MCPGSEDSGGQPRSATLEPTTASPPRKPGAASSSGGMSVISEVGQDSWSGVLIRRDDALARVGLSASSLLSLLLGGVAYANGDGNVRVVAFLYFLLVGIGSAAFAPRRSMSLPARLSLTFVVSMAVLTFISLIMSTESFWHPVPAFIIVASVAVVLHALGLVRGLQDMTATRRARVADPTAGARRGFRDIVSAIGTSWVCIVAGTGLWLSAALTHRHIDPGFGGFLTKIGPLWFVGVVLVLFGLFLARKRPERTAAAAVVVLMLALTLTPSLVYDGARSTTGAKHVGLVQQIRQGTPLDTDTLIYNYWNGFFAAMAWVSDLLGIKDPSHFSAFWPSIVGLFRISALRYLVGRFLHNSYHAWTAVALCLLADPIGADYYSPQSVGFVLGITAFAVALSSRSMRYRGPMLLLIGCLLAVSHQLSPYVTAVALIAMVIFWQLRPWWSPLLVLLPANAWALIHRDALKGFVSLDDIGHAQNFSPPKTVGVEGLTRLPIVQNASLCLVAGIFVIAVLAGLSILTFRDRRSFSMGACAVSGFVFVAVSPYGNEGIFRAFLFSIPWLVLLAMRWVTTRSWEKWAMFGLRPIMLGLFVTFIIASFALDAINVTKPGDLRAMQTFEALRLKPTQAPAFLLQVGQGNLPGNLPAKAVRQTEIDRSRLDDPVDERADADGTATVARLTAELLEYANETPAEANLYAIWSPLSSEFGRAYALERPETFAGIRDAFVNSPYWTVVVQKDGTFLFRFNGAAYPKPLVTS